MSKDFRSARMLSISCTQPMAIPARCAPQDDESPVEKSASAKKAKCVLSLNVIEAPAMRGTAMYEVKVSYNNNKQTRMMKTLKEFLTFKSMFQLLALTSKKGNNCCALCQDVSQLPCISTQVSGRSDNAADILDSFLSNLIEKLQACTSSTILECSAHMGVVSIMTEFLELRNGLYLCQEDDSYSSDEDTLPISHCSLSKSLSKQFAAYDAVC
ncbi:hypothetical protein SDRG_01627 [Saprolegnia diclina VS20]|uniref:Uncharacterized protein n=1 Tax=Saprolegnia diclina (strain VS20) TaxID=1156394 RepID=T0QTZ9_SAPDV|nr:hypothetical protein SDRG_01627 [Saprolegnia diclina VS20]EQC41669.1 hypothetical protein SDRG_01627 [Saprolegnia diclina VS20]|eukprot:XP_008605383.1 hypothetical protein SDRG_01627 [Saprolegnia diclina VS20]